MRKYFTLLSIICAAIAFASCEKEENYGYPSTVEISARGETAELCGSAQYPYIVHIEILDYNGRGNGGGYESDAAESFRVTTDWLTVETQRSENRLHLTATPNSSGRQRKLYLYLYSGATRQEIKVIQHK